MHLYLVWFGQFQLYHLPIFWVFNNCSISVKFLQRRKKKKILNTWPFLFQEQLSLSTALPCYSLLAFRIWRFQNKPMNNDEDQNAPMTAHQNTNNNKVLQIATHQLSTSLPDEVQQLQHHNQYTVDQLDSYILGQMIKFQFSIKTKLSITFHSIGNGKTARKK